MITFKGYVIGGKEFTINAESMIVDKECYVFYYTDKTKGDKRMFVGYYPITRTCIESLEYGQKAPVNEKELTNKIVHNIQDLKNKIG